MKKLFLSIASLVIIAITTSTVNAVIVIPDNNPSKTASASATATIITPISIEKVAGKDLMFGNIIASATGGTVEIPAAGDAIYVGVSAPISIPGIRQQAEFTVTGFAGATYAVTVSNSTTLTSSGNTMTVDNFETSLTGNSGVLEGGQQTFKVGATLNVEENQSDGNYEGSFNVTVAYN